MRDNTNQSPSRAAGLPEYAPDIAEAFDAYLAELVGWDQRDRWARLPGTFLWHEAWDRIGAALASRGPATPQTVPANAELPALPSREEIKAALEAELDRQVDVLGAGMFYTDHESGFWEVIADLDPSGFIDAITDLFSKSHPASVTGTPDAQGCNSIG